PPRQAVVADVHVSPLGTNRDGGEAGKALGLLLRPAAHALAELRESLADANHLGAEVDIAGARARRLLRTERDEELDGALELREPLAHPRLLLGPKKGHGTSLAAAPTRMI